MATQSSILAWEIPWTDEPGRPQSTGSQRVGHDSVPGQKQQYAESKKKTMQIYKTETDSQT